MKIRSSILVVFAAFFVCPFQIRAEQRQFVKLHETKWSVNGRPVLGTYGAPGVDYLERVRDAGMNLVLGGKKELDPATPEGAFCLQNKIKVMPHVTSFLYHGVKLCEPVSAARKDIPLYFERGPVQQESHIIQIDDELIRYEEMTEDGLVNCERGFGGTVPAEHREGTILFWPEPFKAEIKLIKDSPNLFGYYVLDDSPGDAVSALRAMHKAIREIDPNLDRPVCAGFGDAGSVANLAPGVCDIMMIYWYPVSSRKYDRERTAQEVQHMLATARRRVPGIPFMGIYQAFDGSAAQTGQGVPTSGQLREQLEDFVREGACGLVSFICHNERVPGWADIEPLGDAVGEAMREINETGGLLVRAENETMKNNRIQPQGHWAEPQPMHGYVPAWYVLAPFQASETQMLDTPVPPEKHIDLKAQYPVIGGTARWRIRETTSGTLGLNQIYGVIKNAIAYAFCDVEAPEEMSVQMLICTDDDAWVRLNGEEIHRFTGVRGLEIDKDAVGITLPKGTSRIEVKSHNRAGMWGFFMRFTDFEGRPAQGLKFTPGERAEW